MQALQIQNLPQTRQTWRDKPVRELFAEIIEANPNATEDMLRRRFHEAALGGGAYPSEYMEAILDYAFDAAYRAYQHLRDQPLATRGQLDARARDKAERTAATATKIEQIMLLNYAMPNGFLARHCTLDYVHGIGEGWRRVGKAGSLKKVGEVYDEAELRKKFYGPK